MKKVIELLPQFIKTLQIKNSFLNLSPELLINEKNNSVAIQLILLNAEKVKLISIFAIKNELNWNLISKNSFVLVVFNNKNR